MPKNCLHYLLCAGMILSLVTVPGCGSNASKQPTEKAEKNVEQFLDAWSRGEPPDKFSDPNETIQGTDPDWKAGYRLMSFLADEAKQSQETPDHIRCRVALSLQDRKGKRLDRQVVYDVQMGEKIIISRVSP